MTPVNGVVRHPLPAATCRLGVVLLVVIATLAVPTWARVVVTWDFVQGAHGWQGNPQVEGLTVMAEGLAFGSAGNDPWIEGPAVDLPGEGMTRVRLHMKSDADGGGELFYGRTFQAGRSVRFTVRNDGLWHDYSLLIAEPLGPGTRFRLDPATGVGRVVVGWMAVETLPAVSPPPFERPRAPSRAATASGFPNPGELALSHHRAAWGDFVIKVAGTEMAAGYQAEVIGVLLGDQLQWLRLQEAQFTCERVPDGAIVCRAVLRDGAGGRWQVTRRFRAGPQKGTISVEAECLVDQDRDVVHLPWLTLFPGLDTFGARKTQGLFAGLEYLDEEPSSSQADLTTPEHVRRTPDPVKITLPLMAIAYDDRYVGLMWEPSPSVAAVFDSPDRIFQSGAHVMALTAPAIGELRLENRLVAHTPLTLRANQPLTMQATILGGRGGTVVSAVRKYVEVRGLPAIPEFAGGRDAAAALLAHGWLDSAIRADGLFRHAIWGESFGAGPAADAIMYMDWLANECGDPGLVGRLRQGCDLALCRLPPGQPYSSAVSHTRTPTAPFVLGRVPAYVEQRKAQAEGLLKHFDEKGIKHYRPGKVDYGKTHFAPHANGLAAADLIHVLEAATLAADPQLIEQALALLDKQTVLYANTVPRGAQTWEVPLHTPDILASAHLVKAYTLGYLISAKPQHLEQARYWAWTGVPFVYLVNPAGGVPSLRRDEVTAAPAGVGPYATIAVLGATNWRAPVWFGRPVQWCGLVYASALHLLSQYDREGPWETIAKGITATGLQMTWPTSDRRRQGLLPDIFELQAQFRDGPAINPGTVQAHVPELFGMGTLYNVKRLPEKGWFLHTPCAIHDLHETEDSVTFVVDGWGRRPFHVLLAGVEQEPAEVTVRPPAPALNAEVAADRTRIEFRPQQRLLVLNLDGPSEVQLRFP